MLERITLTGAGEGTHIDALVSLAMTFPEVELGLLYTVTPEGRARYPSRSWLINAAKELEGRVAIHVCGSGARAELMRGDLEDLTRYAPRVQVNGILSIAEAESLAGLVRVLITQHCERNVALLDVKAANHVVLLDASGGRGVRPFEWVVPKTSKCVGFAGGIGPDNIQDVLGEVIPKSAPGGWIDMEGKLRTDADEFDVERALRCAKYFTDHPGRHA